MESMGVGFVAVIAVSGTVALIARQLHKRLVSDFMKKIEFELSGSDSARCSRRKKIEFVEDVMEPSSNNKAYRRRPYLMRSVKDDDIETKDSHNVKVEDTMPLNWQILYKGKYKALKSYKSTLIDRKINNEHINCQIRC